MTSSKTVSVEVVDKTFSSYKVIANLNTHLVMEAEMGHLVWKFELTVASSRGTRMNLTEFVPFCNYKFDWLDRKWRAIFGKLFSFLCFRETDVCDDYRFGSPSTS